MKVQVRVLLLLLFAFLFANAKSKAAFNHSELSDLKFVPGQVVVKFKPVAGGGVNADALNSVVMKFNVEDYEPVFKTARNKKAKKKYNLENIFLLKVAEKENVLDICNELNSWPNVEYAEPNYIIPVDNYTPNDPLYSSQYHLPQVHAPEAWDIQKGDTSVVIGIIDTGVDWDHEDLMDKIWTNPGEIPDNGIDDDGNGYIDDVRGWDFVDGITDVAQGEDGMTEDNDPMDFDGHGTHVAGIAAASTDNGVGISAVSFGARIMPLRCGWHASDGNGYVGSAFAAKAYQYAADNGAVITNQSSGSSGQLIVDAAYYAFSNGVLICESAGNSNAVTPSVLGQQPFVMTVASVNNMDAKATYSSYGEYVDISAPGGDFSSGNRRGILSTIVYNSQNDPKYVEYQGTSMASPLAASVAGLVKQAEPNLTVLDLYTRLQKTADNIDNINPDYVGLLGAGRVNAYRALTEKVYAEPNFNFLSLFISNDDNGNNKLEPGETATINVIIQNTWKDATNINVSLNSLNAWPLTIVQGNANIASLPGILNVENSIDTIQFQVSCASDAYPLKDSLKLVFTDGGSFNQEIIFTLSIAPEVLVVGDYKDLDVSSYYLNVLDKYNISYDYIDRRNTVVDTSLLNNYAMVIWSCEWAFPSLEDVDRNAIQGYLDQGGKLFISGQDIGWDLADVSSSQYNEYGRSGGASLTFYQNYLKADFVADNSNYSTIAGVTGDPIGDGLNFSFYQPGRAADQQFPDVIAPRNGAQAIFEYPDGSAGALKYDGTYKLIYFAFGGFEAISDSTVRETVMARIIDWMFGLHIDHTPLKDTEQADTPLQVAAKVTGNPAEVQLLWKKSSDVQYQVVTLTSDGSGNYVGQIPGQPAGTYVDYFILAKSASGEFVSTPAFSFYIGADQIPPTIQLVNAPYDTVTVNAYGPAPYLFHVQANDNIGILKDSVKINVLVDGNKVLEKTLADSGMGNYYGTFSFTEPLQRGQIITYYFSAVDSSQNKNKSFTQTYSIMIDTAMVVDNFENGLDKWEGGTYWGLGTLKYEGSYSLDDRPGQNYENNLNDPIEYKKSFNLTNYQTAFIKLFARYYFDDGDTCFVEVSTDSGKSWEKVHAFTGTQIPRWGEFFIDLNNYAGMSDLRLRFRMQTDASGQRSGINIDYIRFYVSEQLLGINDDNQDHILTEFELKPVYPNPFNPSATFEFSLPRKMDVTISIYSITGQKVAEVVNKSFERGVHKIVWNAKDAKGNSLPTGIFFYRFTAGDKIVKTGKMILVK